MRLIAILAAAAATLIAAPASAASLHVSTTGKSPEQLQAEVRKAAVEVCWAATKLDVLAFYTRASCVQAATRDALAAASRPLTTAQR